MQERRVKEARCPQISLTHVHTTGDDKYNFKYFKGQSKESKESRRARNKASKRTKFDPEKVETTRDVKERLAREEDEDDDDDDQEEEVVVNNPKSKVKPSDKKYDIKKTIQGKVVGGKTAMAPHELDPTPKEATGEPTSKSRIEALRAKLHAKLAEQRSKRPSDPNTVSKRAARRAVKQQRTEEAKKRKATTKVGQGEKAKQYTVAPNSGTSTLSDLANLDFGKLAGLNPTPKNFANNKSLANINKKKNLHKMLADAEEKRKKLEELKRSSDEGDKAKHQQLVWSDALKEASGERIKDDPNKLRKALKHKIAKKEKSAKAWKSRMETTKQKLDERQKIRNHNLEKRKVGGSAGANLSSKKIATEEKVGEDGTTPSRRLSRAGFEGKKQGFLNQGSSAKKGEKKGKAQ